MGPQPFAPSVLCINEVAQFQRWLGPTMVTIEFDLKPEARAYD